LEKEVPRTDWRPPGFDQHLQGDVDMRSITQKDIERFWGKVDKESSQVFYNGTRCWEWTAACHHQGGYGQVWMGTRILAAHRVSYELTYGSIPDEPDVLHHCDNRRCVNPDHLFLGTDRDNIDDKVRKNRQQRMYGEANGRSKLSDAQVAEIRRRYRRNGIGGENSNQLAEEFGVSGTQVLDIVNYKSRKQS
jgi:hypothetical protein